MKKKTSNYKGDTPFLQIPLCLWLTYLLVCTFLLTGLSAARYSTTGAGEDSARAAACSLIVSPLSSSNLSLDANGGPSSAACTFTVSNSGSEVALEYDIEIQANLPPNIQITLDGSLLSGNGSVYLEQNAGTFEAGSPDSHPHTLTFSGTPTSDTAVSVSVVVHARQID